MALASYTNLTQCYHSVMCSKKSPGQMYCGTYATGSCARWAKGKLTEGNCVQIAETTRSRLQIVALPGQNAGHLQHSFTSYSIRH